MCYSVITITGQTVQFRIKGHAAAGSSKDHSEDIKNIQASIMKKMLKIQLMTSSEMSRELISIEIERMICLHSRLIEYDREIKDVTGGSVIVSIMCPTLEALDDLHQLFMSGKLARMFTNAYVADEYRQSVTLNVTIDETEWQRCRAHLLSTGETLCVFIHLFGNVNEMLLLASLYIIFQLMCSLNCIYMICVCVCV